MRRKIILSKVLTSLAWTPAGFLGIPHFHSPPKPSCHEWWGFNVAQKAGVYKETTQSGYEVKRRYPNAAKKQVKALIGTTDTKTWPGAPFRGVGQGRTSTCSWGMNPSKPQMRHEAVSDPLWLFLSGLDDYRSSKWHLAFITYWKCCCRCKTQRERESWAMSATTSRHDLWPTKPNKTCEVCNNFLVFIVPGTQKNQVYQPLPTTHVVNDQEKKNLTCYALRP